MFQITKFKIQIIGNIIGKIPTEFRSFENTISILNYFSGFLWKLSLNLGCVLRLLIILGQNTSFFFLLIFPWTLWLFSVCSLLVFSSFLWLQGWNNSYPWFTPPLILYTISGQISLSLPLQHLSYELFIIFFQIC